MLTTIISILSMFILFLVCGLGVCEIPGFEVLAAASKGYFAFFFGASFFLSLLPWMCMLYLSQGAEAEPIMMYALRSNLSDKKMYAYSGGIFVVSLAGLIIALQSIYPLMWSFVGMVICVGILIDLLRMTYCRFQFRRTPEGLVEWFTEVTRKSVKRRDEKWHSISFESPFTLMGVFIKCNAYGSLRLFCLGIAEMSDLWLGSIARLLLFRVPTENEESLLDRYTHAERETAKRIGWLIKDSCAMGALPGVEEISRLTGKLFVSFHDQHPSLGYFLLSTLSEASEKDGGKIAAHILDMEVVTTFWEIVKALIERSRARYGSDAPTIHDVLVILEDKVKRIKEREITLDPDFVMQPMSEIDHMLGRDRYKSFPGREDVVAELKRLVVVFSE